MRCAGHARQLIRRELTVGTVERWHRVVLVLAPVLLADAHSDAGVDGCEAADDRHSSRVTGGLHGVAALRERRRVDQSCGPQLVQELQALTPAFLHRLHLYRVTVQSQ